MANNSSKLFQKAITKSLKTTLFTTSTLALMLGSSGTLGTAQIDNNAQFSTGTGFNPVAAFAGGALKYITNDGSMVNADAAVAITSIDVNSKAPGLFTVNQNISLGAVSDSVGGGALPVTVSDTFTLTLTGVAGGSRFADNTYDKLGAITLAGANAGLTINVAYDGIGITLAGSIDGENVGEGKVMVNTATDFTAAIGGTTEVGSVVFNNGTAVSTAKNIKATTVTVGKDGGNHASVVETGTITGAVHFEADGKLTVDNGIVGAVTTATYETGTLIIAGGNINNVGADGAALAEVTFNNTAASNAGNIFATNVTVNNAGTEVTTGTVNGAINFAAAGKLIAGGLVTGKAVLTTDGTLTLGNGITGDITSVGNNGTVIVTADDVANVGTAANAIKQLTFNNIAESKAGNIFATNVAVNNAGTEVTTGTVNGAINYAAAGKLIADDLVIGNVNFTADGVLKANNGITGAVTATNGNGTLTTLGNVTKTIGVDRASLKVLNVGVNDGNDVVLGGNVYAKTVNFDDDAFGGGAVGTIQVAGSLVATNINFGANAQGGTLEFNGPAGTIYKLSGTIGNGNKAILNINTGKVVAIDPSIGTVAQININAGNNFIVNAEDNDIDLLDGQNIAFKGAASGLVLCNGRNVDDRTITLKDNLPGLANGGGILTLYTINKTLTIQGDGGAKTIGTAGNELAALNIVGNNIELNDIDTTNVGVLNIVGATQFVDTGNITNQIKTINIGTANADLDVVVASPASYTIDTNGGNVNILAGGQIINFADADAKLVLQNSSAGANGTITLNAELDPGAANKGILELNSVDANRKLILAAGAPITIGTNANKLKQLIFSGAGKFDISKNIKIILDTLGINTTSEIGLGEIFGDLTFGAAGQVTQSGNIGTFVDFNGNNATLTLADNVNIGDVVKNTSGNSNGTIIASGASTINGPITGLAMLKVGAKDVSLTAEGDYSITEIQGNGTGTLKLPKIQLTGAINATGGTALNLNFSGGGRVSGNVGTAANPVGNITTIGPMRFNGSVFAKGATNFSGTTSFLSTFSNIGEVTLAKDSVTGFGDNVTATSFVAHNATLGFGKNLAFNANITGSGTTLNLDKFQVAYTGNASFTDMLTINTVFDGEAKSGGNILIKSDSTLDLSQASNLVLNVTAINFNINNIDSSSQYKVILAEADGGLKPISADKVSLNINGQQNKLIKISLDTSNLTLFAEDISDEVIEEEFAPNGPLVNIPNASAIKESFELLANVENGSDAKEAWNNAGSLDSTQRVEFVNHLLQNNVKPSEVVAACNQAVSGNILGNLTSVSTRIDRIQAANNTAAAAGDEDIDSKFGAWINPFIGNATQKKIQNISGYKSDTTGGTIGFDGMINDDAVLGLAYTRAETNIKLKDNKQGDKNKIHSNIYSVYGLYNLPYNNFFVEGVASYGNSDVKTKTQRNIAVAQNTVGYQTAIGKYKSENYTGQIMVGYNYTLPETISTIPAVVTPLAGIRYSDIKDKGYKETDVTYQNLIVKGKSYNTFDGMLGARLSSSFNTGEVVLTPELYAMVDYAFKNKAPAIDARLQGMAAPFPTDSFKPKKTSFDLGAGVTIKHKMMEYGINYDANIASKYFAQQGSVKVRVNF